MKLRPIEPRDYRFLFSLLEERPEYANISHTEMPTYGHHVAFIQSCPYAAWYVIVQGKERLGSAYLSRQNEIGIFITKKHQGKGIAKWAIKELMRLHPREMYIANVAPKNTISRGMFKRLGFKARQISFVQCHYQAAS